jgi:Lysylphosphatidylglycerol synthase TM region
LAPIIFIVVCWSLYYKIVEQQNLDQSIAQIKGSFATISFWLALVLVVINWGIEAVKWQIQLKPLEQISFKTAFKSVLAGCSITMITPNRVGEYGGRIFYVKEENRIDAIPLTILGSMSQLFVTLVIGAASLISMLYFSNNIFALNSLPSYTAAVMLYVSIAGACFLLLAYLRVSLIVKFLSKFTFLEKVVSHIVLLHTFSRKQLLRILFLSFLRYSIFILQYILLLQAMQVQIDFVTSYKLIAIFYLIMAMAPTIGFTELPIRAAASVEVLQLYSTNIVGIQAAASAIFFINLVLPAIIGSILIFGIKILKEK